MERILKISGKKVLAGADGDYEIDASAEFEAFDARFVVLVECKRYTNKPIEREVVQVLRDKLGSIGAHKGMIFSTSDFQSGAIEYAQKHGIALVKVESGATTVLAKHDKPFTEIRDEVPDFVGWLVSNLGKRWLTSENPEALLGWLRERGALLVPQDTIGEFHGIEEAGQYFLHCAFEEIALGFQITVAGRLFAKKVDEIPAPEGWTLPSLPEGLEAWLQDDLNVLPEETIAKFSAAWTSAQADAESAPVKLAAGDDVDSIEVVGHVVNLSAFVESVMNRQLLFMSATGRLESDFYKALDRTEAIPKLLFIFKEQILGKKLSASRITQLFRLRNAAVHFKGGNREKLRIRVEDLRGIWKAVADVVALTEGRPGRSDVDDLVQRVSERWLTT